MEHMLTSEDKHQGTVQASIQLEYFAFPFTTVQPF